MSQHLLVLHSKLLASANVTLDARNRRVPARKVVRVGQKAPDRGGARSNVNSTPQDIENTPRPLVVRHGRGLVPTPRAETLAPLLRDVADRLAVALDRGEFVPEESTRTFTIALADSHQACEVPGIAQVFLKRLPNAKLRVVSADYLAATDGLASGDIDVAFAPEQAILPGNLIVSAPWS